jgi:porin
MGALQLGLWHYTTRFDSIDPDVDSKQLSRGAYALVERQVAALGTSTLRAWARIGVASGRANPIGLYLGGGVAWRSRNGELGLAIAHARRGDPAQRATLADGGPTDRAETTTELTYARRLIPGVTIQPDLQYVINPGWLPRRGDALVAGVRFSFAWPAE